MFGKNEYPSIQTPNIRFLKLYRKQEMCHIQEDLRDTGFPTLYYFVNRISLRQICFGLHVTQVETKFFFLSQRQELYNN
jgi:hypothetical protein